MADERLHPTWVTDVETHDRVVEFLDVLHDYLEGRGELVEKDAFYSFMGKEAKSRNLHRNTEEYLDIIKTVQRIPDGHYGLRDWPEVSPRGVRDKSYIVLKKKGEPLHFRDISDLINATEFSDHASSRSAYPQTVHNELIKDDRFVLVGRGMYALTEWGYEPGTVKEVIKSVLGASKTPLVKEKLVRKVLEQRFVKENTILLNLQDKSVFMRLPSGEFTLFRRV